MSGTRTLLSVALQSTRPSHVISSLGSHFGLYNVSSPCPVQFPEAGQSQFGPLTSRSTPLHPQFAQPMHSSSVSSQPSVAGPPVAPPFGHETHSPAPWQFNIASTVSSTPGFARSDTPYYFPPTLPRYVGTRDPYPTYPNQTRSFDHAMVIGPGLTLAQSDTPYYFPPTLQRYVGTRDPYPNSPNQTRSFDHAMVIGPGFNPCSVRHPLLFFPYVAALCGDS